MKEDPQEHASFQEISHQDVKDQLSPHSAPDSFEEEYEEVVHKNYGKTIPLAINPDGK